MRGLMGVCVRGLVARRRLLGTSRPRLSAWAGLGLRLLCGCGRSLRMGRCRACWLGAVVGLLGLVASGLRSARVWASGASGAVGLWRVAARGVVAGAGRAELWPVGAGRPSRRLCCAAGGDLAGACGGPRCVGGAVGGRARVAARWDLVAVAGVLGG